MRRYLAAGIWLLLTVTATLIVWAAVSVVAADVTDRPAPVVAHRDVVVALHGGPAGSASGAAPTTTATASATTTTAAPARRGGAATVPGARVTTTVPGPTAPSGPVFAPVTTTTSPPSPPTTKGPGHPVPPPTTVAPAVGGTATYSTDGGTVAVACTSFNTIRLVAALPADGYQALVLSGGPFFVQVNLVGQGRNIPVSAVCVFGQPFQGNKGTPGG